MPLLRRLILCVSVLFIVYGLVRLAGYGADLLSSRQTAQELREIAAEPDTPQTPPAAVAAETGLPDRSASPSPGPSAVPEDESPAEPDVLPPVQYPNGYTVVPRIQKLRKKSEYIIGWLAMDDLDEPVVQKDNAFFLNHDATGKRNSNGAIFMDEETSLLTRPYTVLLYGHNMKTGAMFGNLHRYTEYSYCLKHRMFRFDTLYEEGQYVVFAVSRISLTAGRKNYVSLSDIQSTDRELRQDALSALVRCSAHPLMPDVSEEDQLVLLVTCVGDDDERLIVAARRLRDGEQPDRLIMKGR